MSTEPEGLPAEEVIISKRDKKLAKWGLQQVKGRPRSEQKTAVREAVRLEMLENRRKQDEALG